MQQPADSRRQAAAHPLHPAQLGFFRDLLCCSFFPARRRQNVMDQVLWRLQLSQPPDHQHAFQRFSQHRTTDRAIAAMLVKGRPRVGGYRVIQRISQQGFKLAAFHPVFWLVIHCLPAFYYENLRLVYQVQAKVRELKKSAAPAAEPGENRQQNRKSAPDRREKPNEDYSMERDGSLIAQTFTWHEGARI